MEGSDDDFFGDGEDDDNFGSGTVSADFKAMEQNLYTVGFKEGVEQGTQKGIQRGFDQGYARSKEDRSHAYVFFGVYVLLLCLGSKDEHSSLHFYARLHC